MGNWRAFETLAKAASAGWLSRWQYELPDDPALAEAAASQ
jgi:hypothetical protein